MWCTFITTRGAESHQKFRQTVRKKDMRLSEAHFLFKELPTLLIKLYCDTRPDSTGIKCSPEGY